MAQHTAKRAEVVAEKAEIDSDKELSPNSGVNSKRGPKNKGQDKFVRDTASRTGRSKAAVYQDKARGEAIPPDILALIKGTDLDTGTYLDKLTVAT